MVITFESRKKSYPAYLFVFTYALTALVFKDRFQYLTGLVLALGLFLGSYGLGKRLSFLIFKTADQSLYFPIGLGCVLVATYFTGSFSTSRTFFLPIWGLLALLAAFEWPVLAYRINRNYFWAAPLILLAFWSSFTPSIFTNTLEYYLGLPHQYLAIGKIVSLPENLYSSLPPFGPTLTLLFSSLGADSGVKSFHLLIYFQIISILVSLLRWLITEPVFAGGNGRDQDYQTDLLYMTKMELLVIPMLLLPLMFSVIHEQTYDLLTALFFCAAIASMIKEYDGLTMLKIWNIGLLLAFSLWTKYSVIFYIPWIALLWFALSGWRSTRENWKVLGLLMATVLLFWLAIPVRNAIQFGTPFYPAFSGTWSMEQSLYLESETMSRSTGLLESLSRFLGLVFDPRGIGVVLLFSLILYPKARKIRAMNHLLLFGLAGYLTWFFLFRDFRHFLPVFLLLSPVCYFSLRQIYIRWPKQLWIVWGVCAITTLIPLYKYFSEAILLWPTETQHEFLNSRLDYYPIAKHLNEASVRGEVILVGDHRAAYYGRPLITGSRYDRSAILEDLRAATGPEELYQRLRRQGIRYLVYNESNFLQFYGPQGLFRVTESQIQNWQKMIASYTALRMQKGTVRLHEFTDEQIW